MLVGRDIVMIASAPWKIDGKLNCHHLAERLAEHNRVLYVESPAMRMPSMSHASDRRKVVRRGSRWLAGLLRGPQMIHDRLAVLSPPVLPMHGSDVAERVNQNLFGRSVARTTRRLRFSQPLFWSFLPTGIYAAGCFAQAPLIYHCVDDYAGNTGVDVDAIESLEAKLLERANIVFATSRPLADRLELVHDNVRCVPNVADVDRFIPPQPAPDDLATLPRPIIGYVGNLAGFKLDLPLVADIARARTNWSFAFVGPRGDGDPTTDLSQLNDLPNVHLLGPRRYDEIAAYMQHFDAAIIPFRLHRVTEGSFPLKTVEYLASGTPVISTPLPALTAEPLDDVVTYAEDAPSFIAGIEAALHSNDEDAIQKRRDVANHYSWSKRYPQIASAVEELLSPTAV